MNDKFHKNFWVVTCTLLASCLLLVLLLVLQGPRIRHITFDPQQTTSAAGQRILLETNQPLAIMPKHVEITPRTPFTLTSSGKLIAIQLTKRLAYQTRYTIKIDIGTKQLSYTFNTNKPILYYLQHRATSDVIMQQELGSPKDKIVFRADADTIDQFIVLQDALVVNTRGRNGTSTLTRIDTKSLQKTALAWPGVGQVGILRASPNRQSFSFNYTTTKDDVFYNSLFFCATSTSSPKRINGTDGKQIQTQDWRFLPGTNQLVFEGMDNITALAPITGGTATPLGQFNDLLGVAYDGAYVIVAKTAYEVTQIDRKTFKRSNITFKEVAGTGAVDIVPLNNDNGYIIRPYYDSKEGQHLVLQNDMGSKIIYRAAKDSYIVRMSSAPNDQYTVVEETQANHTSNSGTTSTIVDPRSARIVTTLDDATQLQWQ